MSTDEPHKESPTDRYMRKIMEARVEAIEIRITKAEERVKETEFNLNAGLVVFAGIQKDLIALKVSLEEVRAVLARVNWIVLSAVILAALALLFANGRHAG